MINLSNIYYRYEKTSEAWVLHGIDLSIRKGEFVLLCGGSGSGKSTLGYLLNGLIPHFFDGVLQGAVSVSGHDTRDLTVADLLAEVGLVFQNVDAQLFNSSVEKEIAFGLESMGRSAREIEIEIERTAKILDIGHLLDRPPTALSGGEKRLVTIASVLCLKPPVMVLDEPLAHLDWEGAARVRKVLCRLHQEGTTVMVIEQRVGAVLEDATRCVVLDRGKLVFDGAPDASRPTLIEQHLVPQYPLKQESALRKQKPLLQAKEIRYEIDGRPILQNVSVHVKDGEILAIVGRNGSGKTTLIKHFNGLLNPRAGNLLFMGKGVRNTTPPEMAAQIGIAFQNPNDQFFKNTVEEELMIGRSLSGRDSEEWFEELCVLFDLHDLLRQSPYRLSEGQKKRVAVASILVMRPRLLVLDEPTVGQDGRFLEVLAGLLLSLREKGFTVVIVTHDLEFALATAERWLVLYGGRVVGAGPPEELVGDTALIRMGALGADDGTLSRGVLDRAC